MSAEQVVTALDDGEPQGYLHLSEEPHFGRSRSGSVHVMSAEADDLTETICGQSLATRATTTSFDDADLCQGCYNTVRLEDRDLLFAHDQGF